MGDVKGAVIVFVRDVLLKSQPENRRFLFTRKPGKNREVKTDESMAESEVDSLKTVEQAVRQEEESPIVKKDEAQTKP